MREPDSSFWQPNHVLQTQAVLATSAPWTIRRVVHGSPEYQQTVALRSKVLREPLGLQFTPEQLAAEEHSYHFAAFDGERLAGCFILSVDVSSDAALQNTGPDDASVGKAMTLRQVAVLPELQGQGLGRFLMSAAEAFAQQEGACIIRMHARESAVPFYEKLGYVRIGERFTEVTLPHWQMEKSLDATRWNL